MLSPLDAIHLGSPPLDLERQQHFYHPLGNLDRRLRLEQEMIPLEKCVRGSFSSYSSLYPEAQEIHDTYHHPLSRGFGKDDTSSAYIGSYYTGAFEYPSPLSHGVASLSGTDDRSPSPVYVPFAYSMDTSPGFPRWGGGDAAEYGSVIPREVLHGKFYETMLEARGTDGTVAEVEAKYPEPLTPEQKVSQIYPCASVDQIQDEALNDLTIHDDVDADGEPDAMCIDREESKRVLTNQRASKRMPPKTKKGLRDGASRNCATVASPTSTSVPKSPIRKRSAASRKSSQASTRNTNARAVKETTTSSSSAAADRDREKTYSCSFKQYGCESTFSTKNEWKRHFASQHLKLEYYRCDLKGCDTASKGPNDFNRKDLFTQHLRRMHAPWTGGKTNPTAAEKAEFEATLDEHARRCVRLLRAPPAKTSCAECNNIVFTDWSKRMEHMSQHYEHDPQFEEARDSELECWAFEEKILCRRDSSSSELVLADLVHKRR